MFYLIACNGQQTILQIFSAVHFLIDFNTQFDHKIVQHFLTLFLTGNTIIFDEFFNDFDISIDFQFCDDIKKIIFALCRDWGCRPYNPTRLQKL